MLVSSADNICQAWSGSKLFATLMYSWIFFEVHVVNLKIIICRQQKKHAKLLSMQRAMDLMCKLIWHRSKQMTQIQTNDADPNKWHRSNKLNFTKIRFISRIHAFLSLANIFFKIIVFKKFCLEYHRAVNSLEADLILVQTFFKGYQQTTLASKELEHTNKYAILQYCCCKYIKKELCCEVLLTLHIL